ncbi:hypothetical protein [Desulfofalx alkaliphila]|uniref:hypothetical protein n=1 Tax=Desulfofalx alkaliphila TaxID=105483 RepID=UPI0012FF1C6E|nr:hypothetical protein [Desulfofalx alkaliphila]
MYYKTYYLDYEDDPEVARRWQYSHDHEYYDNSLGRVPYHEQWRSNPIYRFDKVGKFTVNFQAQDEPKKDDRFANYRQWSYMPSDRLDIYVHRRPVASFGYQLVDK